MAQIMVTASEVHKSAEQLRNLNSQFQTKLDSLVSRESALVSKWEGDAREAFHSAFNSDKAKMDQFHQVIDEYAIALDQIATNYENAEGKTTQIAASRNS